LREHNPDEPETSGRSQTGKSFWYPDFTNRPDQKSNGLNPGDSAKIYFSHGDHVTASIQSERRRQNFLLAFEAQSVAWLCRRMPRGVTSNRLTALGIAGAGVVFTALLLGRINRWWLLAGIAGLAIHWFGDSLDGRLAYYRGAPRKWYGFVLDVLADWASLCLISAGFIVYMARYEFVPIIFMAAYGAGMLIAVARYKITGHYRIDSGKF
jgi:hypothetical protein